MGLTIYSLDFCSISVLSELEAFLLLPHLIWHIILLVYVVCIFFLDGISFPSFLELWNVCRACDVEVDLKTTPLIFSKYYSCYIA